MDAEQSLPPELDRRIKEAHGAHEAFLRHWLIASKDFNKIAAAQYELDRVQRERAEKNLAMSLCIARVSAICGALSVVTAVVALGIKLVDVFAHTVPPAGY